MTLSYWLDTKMDIPEKVLATENNFDVLIVGAGIAGLSVAYWLEQKDANLKIAILDKGAVLGSGASGRNAGFITCGSSEHFFKLQQQFGLEKATEIWKFSEKNRELLKSEIFQDDFTSVDFSTTGSCTVASSELDWTRYQDVFKTMQAAGIDVELIDEKYLSEYYGVRNFLGAIQYKHDGVINPVRLLKKIMSKLKNTKFFLNAEIKNYQAIGPSWNVNLGHRQVSAAKIVFCLNGYSSTLIPELIPIIKPQRGQILVTEPLEKFVQGPCYLTKHLCYFRQLSGGELLIGGFRNHDPDAENTNEDQITEKIQTALTQFTENYFQKTKNIKINYRWSGVMGFSPDGQMVLGELTSKKGLFTMAGCSGHGMGLSFHAAQVLVQNIYGHAVPTHLDLHRFK